jgi:hypothetical protein
VNTVIRKQSFCGDNLNLFNREDQNYHWSCSYWYYSNLFSKEKNRVWTSEIVLAGCVPEVFECKDIVTWCIEKFIQNRRVVAFQNSSPISLAPSIFIEILKFPDPNLFYKGEEARNFLKIKNNRIDILQEYLHDPALMPEDISIIQVSSLKNPYK